MELAPRTRPTHAPLIGGAPSFDAVMATPNRRVVRRIFMAESRDFLNWSEPRLILAPDPDLNNLDIAFYGMRPFRLGGHWIGFLGVFHQVSNTSTVELVHSRDGRRWERLAPTHDWIGLGEPGSWSANQIGIPRIVDVGDDETWVYFGGATSQHDLWYAHDPGGFARPIRAYQERPSLRAGNWQAPPQWVRLGWGGRNAGGDGGNPAVHVRRRPAGRKRGLRAGRLPEGGSPRRH